MSPLVEFLLARIADDEDRVTSGAPGTATSYNGWHTVDCGVGLGYWANDRCECRYVDRVLAECEAKREIVGRLRAMEVGVLSRGGLDVAISELRQASQFLALPYAEHPDYDEAWRP
jgi:hypothetical protein